MREEELRSRLQALAVAGRGTPEPTAFGAVRRRARRKLQGAAALVVGLVVAVAGVWLAADAARRPGATPVVPVAPPSGPPAAVAPDTFVAQVGDGASRRTVIVDARTGRVVRQVPGTQRQADVAADAVVAPDLRSMYLPAATAGAAASCDAGWTQVDLANGRRQPAFGGLTFIVFAGVTDAALLYIEATALAHAPRAEPRRQELLELDLSGTRSAATTDFLLNTPGSSLMRTVPATRTPLRCSMSSSWRLAASSRCGDSRMARAPWSVQFPNAM